MCKDGCGLCGQLASDRNIALLEQHIAETEARRQIVVTAPEDGTAFLYNRSTSKMIYSGRLKRGETIELDPKRDQIRVDGRTAQETSLRDMNEYQMWFDPEAHPGSRIDVKTSAEK